MAVQRISRAAAMRTRIQQKMAVIEDLRFSLPVAQYLKTLQEAAFTGYLPLLRSDGTYTGEDQELNAKERIDLFKYMTNKSLPDRAATPEQLGREEIIDVAHVSSQSLEDMSDEQIQKLLSSDNDPANI